MKWPMWRNDPLFAVTIASLAFLAAICFIAYGCDTLQ